MRIALDAMGGDRAPREIVAGAILASQQYNDIELLLVGREAELKEELAGKDYSAARIAIINAAEVIGMDEPPSKAIRQKRDSSLVKALNLLKAKEADAFISAGNTGAVMAGSLLILGRLKGIKRPSILINFPSAGGQTLVMDNGANIDSKPEHLLQYALMGQVYARQVIKKSRPRVGLLSIGEEKEKGTQLVKDTYDLLTGEQKIANFIGNVEGRDIFNGSCDLVVCDGFIGNIILKTTEGVASYIFQLLKNMLNSSWRAKMGALLLKPYLKKMKEKVDYRQYGGAPLLGVNGVVIISHGSSDSLAILNAIKVAKETVAGKIVNIIEEEIIKDGEING